MKYKVVREFDPLRKGDILENSTEKPEIFAFEEETDTNYKYVSYGKFIIDELVKEGCLTLIEVPDEDSNLEELENKICSVVDEIDRLLDAYEKDNDEVHSKFEENKLPYCAVVEADTVHKNLSKVLTHIKDMLTDNE